MLRGELQFPGDKSISHRMLMIGALAQGTSSFTNCATGLDVRSTAACLQHCGTEIHFSGSGGTISGGHWKHPTVPLNCGNSGTTARLLSGLLAGQRIPAELQGDTSLSGRPMGRILKPLELMGAEITSKAQRLPLQIQPASLKGIEYTLPIPSAQVKSAILLAGLGAEGRTVISSPLASRDHTEIMLEQSGADIEFQGTDILLKPGTHQLAPLEIDIPGDPSTAAFFAAAACLMPASDLLLQNILANPTRTGFFKIMQKMGANLEWLNLCEKYGELTGDLRIRSGSLQAIEIAGEDIPALVDELPILAVVATQAEGRTKVSGASELRLKETDRIRAICENLRKIGGSVEELPDGFIVNGPTVLHGGSVKTHGDHRIAMAFTVADLISDGKVKLDKPDCVKISCPEFYQLLKSVLH